MRSARESRRPALCGLAKGGYVREVIVREGAVKCGDEVDESLS